MKQKVKFVFDQYKAALNFFLSAEKSGALL